MTTLDEIKYAIHHIPATDRQVWLKIGMALKSELGEQGFDIWDQWSKSASSYKEKDALDTWKSIEHSGGITIRTLFYEAQKNGYESYQNRYARSAVHQPQKTIAKEQKALEKQNPNIIWRNAQPCVAHRYLSSKAIKSHGTRTQIIDSLEYQKIFWVKDQNSISEPLTGNLLLIPLYNINRTLGGLQAIDERGRKSLLKGMTKKGLFYPISGGMQITTQYNGRLYIAEGFATAATLYEVTEIPTVMAIDAGNLKSVALSWREYCPHAEIIIAGDRDESGTGQKAAFEAAASVKGLLVLPRFSGNSLLTNGKAPSDFNDLFLLEGESALKESLQAIEKIGTDDDIHCPHGSLDLLCAKDITPEPIEWFWKGWLACGKLHILAGAPGTGKTSIALKFAATITTGSLWPDGNRSSTNKSVILWSGEDDFKDTLLPRLKLMGADLNQVFFINGVKEANNKARPVDPAKDIAALNEACKNYADVGLIIIDPIVSAVAGDSHKNGEVRRDLQPLVDLAAKFNCVLIGVSHLSKGTTGKEPLERVTGSLAFSALARLVLMTVKNTEASSTHTSLLVRAKSNIGPNGDAFAYSLEQRSLPENPAIEASTIIWGQHIVGSPATLFKDAEEQNQQHNSELEEAENFLRDVLSAGEIPSKDIYSEASELGITKATLKRAKKKLNVQAVKKGFDGKSQWYCFLPTEGAHPYRRGPS